MQKYHKIEKISFSESSLLIKLDGCNFEFSLENVSQALLHATEEERNCFTISPSGYGIHWTLLDEDLSIDGLLGIIHNPENQRMIA